MTDGDESGRTVGAPDPACWSWPLPQGDYTDAPVALLRDFHKDRCAICGTRALDLVTDHDHYTGLVRGKLCRFCNAQEGRGSSPMLAKYRSRPPALILAVEIIYEGLFWDYERDASKFHGPRPEDDGPWTNNAAAKIGL